MLTEGFESCQGGTSIFQGEAEHKQGVFDLEYSSHEHCRSWHTYRETSHSGIAICWRRAVLWIIDYWC